MTGRFPHVLAIIIASIILAWLATYVVPQGEYERKYDPKAKREVVVSGTYHRVKAKPLSLFDMVVCIPRGIVEGGEVIVTIFLIGACFYVVEKTGALKQGKIGRAHV